MMKTKKINTSNIFAKVTALFLCALLLVAFVPVEVRAEDDPWVTIHVFAMDITGQESLFLSRDLVFALRYNGVIIEENDIQEFLPYFRMSDIPYLDIMFVRAKGWTSEETIVPLSQFYHHGNGLLTFRWYVSPVSGNVEDTPPTGYTPPTETPPVAAERVLRFTIGSTTFTDNNVANAVEAAPFIADDRTMVPLRVIAEAFGATNLNMTNGVITFNIGAQAFSKTIGQQLAGNMGIPVIVADRTFVPLAFVAQNMGATVRWDGPNQAAYVYI